MVRLINRIVKKSFNSERKQKPRTRQIIVYGTENQNRPLQTKYYTYRSDKWRYQEAEYHIGYRCFCREEQRNLESKIPRQTTELCGNKHNTTRVEIGIGHYRRNIGLTDKTKGLKQRKLNGEDSECTRCGKKALKMDFFNDQATEF